MTDCPPDPENPSLTCCETFLLKIVARIDGDVTISAEPPTDPRDPFARDPYECSHGVRYWARWKEGA